MKRIVLATRNAGKINEIRSLLAGLPLVLIPASEIPGAPEPDETYDTLEGNAGHKALELSAFTGLPALADDTGLEVSALGGRPGVYSARYAGIEANPVANRARLLAELTGRTDRSARFRTVIALAEGETARYFEGVCDGSIAEAERGSGGFGYDPIFIPEGQVRTFAEMTLDEKNRISHRGAALKHLAAYLQDHL
jgi:XTP/dITP diphosphohydrolase